MVFRTSPCVRARPCSQQAVQGTPGTPGYSRVLRAMRCSLTVVFDPPPVGRCDAQVVAHRTALAALDARDRRTGCVLRQSAAHRMQLKVLQA